MACENAGYSEVKPRSVILACRRTCWKVKPTLHREAVNEKFSRRINRPSDSSQIFLGSSDGKHNFWAVAVPEPGVEMGARCKKSESCLHSSIEKKPDQTIKEIAAAR